MSDLIEVESKSAVTDDRRRPGRLDIKSRYLIALFRQQPLPDLDKPADMVDEKEVTADPVRDAPLSAARGIGLGVVLGAISWVCIALVLWRLFAS